MTKRGTNTISYTKPPLLNLSISTGISPLHGHVLAPESRAYFAWQAGQIDAGALNQRESGKFYPLTNSGQKDSSAPDDMVNDQPPADGKIASAGQATGQILDEPGTQWKKHEVRSGEELDVSWHFTAMHKTRRWNYFITRADWDPMQKLSRAQFEPTPFHKVENEQQPYWAHQSLLPKNPTTHSFTLPEREGYHVLLAVWEVADTGNAFYQVIDLDFVPKLGGNERPSTPTGFASGKITHNSVGLRWNAATSPHPISVYRIIRDGLTTVDIEASQLEWTDNNAHPSTKYNYFIMAIDINGNASAPSRAIDVITPAEGGEQSPPTAPVNLHSMGETSNSVNLMWGASEAPVPLESYIIYRNGIEVNRVSGNQTSVTDTGLTPNTTYRYFVTAIDTDKQMSVPSNVLLVRTKVQNGGGDYPAWMLNTIYEKDQGVSHNGKNWEATQKHVSYTTDWAPGAPDSFTLWERID